MTTFTCFSPMKFSSLLNYFHWYYIMKYSSFLFTNVKVIIQCIKKRLQYFNCNHSFNVR